MNEKTFRILMILSITCLLIIPFTALIITKNSKNIITHINTIDNVLIEKSIQLAKVINKECGDCPDVDKLLIGSSILNRKDHENFPNKLIKVIEQPNQYATSTKYTEHDKNLSECLLEGYFRDCDVLYFYNPKTSTNSSFLKQTKKRKLIVKTQNHEYR